MPNPTVFVEVKSIGVEKTKREIREVANEAERLEKINSRLAQSGARKAGEGIRRVGTSAKSAAKQTDQATKALRQFDSRLGGARRASAQFAQAQDRLNQAYDAGIINLRQYNQRLDEARKRFTTAEVKSRDLRDNLRLLAGSAGRGARGFRQLASAIGPLVGIGAAAGLGTLVSRSLESAANLRDLANRAGVTTQALQELSFAAQQYGVRQQTLIDGLRELQVRAGEFASGGGGEASEAFERIGLSARQAQRLVSQSDNGLTEIIRRIRELDSAAARAQAFDQLFGDEAGQALRQFTGDIRNLRREARELGTVMTDQLIAKADRMRDDFLTLTSVISKQFTVAVVEASDELLTLLRGLAERLPSILASINEFLGFVNEAKAGTLNFNPAAESMRQLADGAERVRDVFDGNLGKDANLKQLQFRLTELADENERAAQWIKRVREEFGGSIDTIEEARAAYEMLDGAMMQARREAAAIAEVTRMPEMSVGAEASRDFAAGIRQAGEAAEEASDPVKSLNVDFADLRKRMAAVQPAIDRHQAMLDGTADKAEDAAKGTKDFREETRDAGREATEFERAVTGAFEEAGRSVQREFADLFKSGEFTFRSLVDIAKNTAAEIAAAFTFQRIVTPVVAAPLAGESSR